MTFSGQGKERAESAHISFAGGLAQWLSVIFCPPCQSRGAAGLFSASQQEGLCSS